MKKGKGEKEKHNKTQKINAKKLLDTGNVHTGLQDCRYWSPDTKQSESMGLRPEDELCRGIDSPAEAIGPKPKVA